MEKIIFCRPVQELIDLHAQEIRKGDCKNSWSGSIFKLNGVYWEVSLLDSLAYRVLTKNYLESVLGLSALEEDIFI